MISGHKFTITNLSPSGNQKTRVMCLLWQILSNWPQTWFYLQFSS